MVLQGGTTGVESWFSQIPLFSHSGLDMKYSLSRRVFLWEGVLSYPCKKVRGVLSGGGEAEGVLSEHPSLYTQVDKSTKFS